MTKIKTRLVKIFSLGLVVMATLLSTASVWAEAKNIDIHTSDYGYGDYTVRARGVGYGGVYDEDLVTFHYYPVTASLSMDEDAERIYVDLDYKAYDPTSEDSGNVAKIVIYVYDQDGNQLDDLTTTVYPDQKRVPFGYGDKTASGSYTFKIYAYGKDGDLLYREPFVISTDYTIIPVPDTGGLFSGLNISKVDYLATGLIIFGVVAVSGFIFIARSNKKQSRLRSKRKR